MSEPFGVEIPENFGSPESASATTDTAREGAQNAASERSAAKETETSEPQITDLDSLERFRFQGRELSKDDLQKLLSTGSASNGESENAKFDSNFRFDLAAVLEDPRKLSAFREIYPPEYVQIVERALAQQKRDLSSTGQPDPNNAKDPRLDEVYSVMQEWKAEKREARVNELKETVDRTFDKFQKKYPDADPEVINSRLIALRQLGTELRDAKGQLKENVIEELFKKDHTARSKAREDWWNQKVEAQKRANSQSRDVGHGGSASSPAPKKAQNIKQATAMALDHFETR